MSRKGGSVIDPIGRWLAIAAAAMVLLSMCATTFAATWAVPPGTRTDCGPGFSGYEIKHDVTCADRDDDCWRTRYGPEYPRSKGNRCQQSESEPSAFECFAATYGHAPTKSERLDMVLSASPWLAREVFSRCCLDCDSSRPLALLRDKDKAYFRGSNCLGFGESRRADNLPCGLITGYNCAWQWAAYFDNRAPNCLAGGQPPAPRCGDGKCNGVETCGTCEADCNPCPCPPVAVPGVASTGRLVNGLVADPAEGKVFCLTTPEGSGEVYSKGIGLSISGPCGSTLTEGACPEIK